MYSSDCLLTASVRSMGANIHDGASNIEVTDPDHMPSIDQGQSTVPVVV